MLQLNKYIKLLIALLSLSAIFASCEKEIPLDDSNFKPRLYLYYLGSEAGSSKQKFYISEVYTGRKPRIIKDAKLEVFVNNQLKQSVLAPKGVSENDPNCCEEPRRHPYIIRNDFKVGDKVKFRVSHPNYPKSEAEITIAKAPEFSFAIKEMDEGAKWNKGLQFKIKVQDIPNERNFYRLKIYHSSDRGRVLDNGVHYKEDYILMKGQPQADTKNNDFDFSWNQYENRYLVFSDELFKDKDGVITVYTNRYEECIVYVTVEGIDEATFRYLQAMDNLADDDNPLVTPSIVPTNVVGGVGLVSIAGSRTKKKLFIPINP